MPVAQSEINNVLWKACDTFRGVVDPSDYKNYVLTFLFVKYISDVWKDHRAAISEKYKGDEAMIQRQLKRERFQLPDNCTFDHLYEHRNESNIGELIDTALEHIEEANRSKLQGVFRNISFNSDTLGTTKDRNRRLKHLIEDFNDPKLDLRPSVIDEDLIGNAYMYMIERFAADSGKKGGEFYTPTCVSKLVAKLANPKEGDRICDPAAGSCSLLIRAANEVVDKTGTPSRNYSLFAQESNGATWALGRMNLFLHGKDSAESKWGDTINNPQLIESDKLIRFDVVVANPPFSLDKWGHEDASDDPYNRFWRGTPPKSKGDYAFVSHMVEAALPKKGRVAVIVPHGVLFRGGAEGKIRKRLIEENLLDAVIGLPEKLFFGTGIPAAILVFDRSREEGGVEEGRKDVLFIDASRDYLKGKNQNELSDEQCDNIINHYQERKATDKYSHLAMPDEIAENDYNLNIPRYVDTFEEEEEIDIAATKTEIAALEDKLATTRAKLNGYLKELGV